MHLVASSTTVWYAARAGGVVSYVLISASVLAGDPARRQEAHPGPAALCGRGRPPVPRPPRRTVHRDSRRLDRPRHRGAVLARPARDPVHGELPPARDRPRHRGPRAPPRRRGDEPAAGTPAVQGLAARTLRHARRLAPRHRPWHPQRHRSQRNLAAGGVRHNRRVGGGSGRPAVRPRPHAATARRRACGRGRGACVLVLGLSALPQQASTPKTSSTTATAASIPDINGTITGTIDQSDGSGIVSISGTAASQSSFRIDLLTGGNEVADTASSCGSRAARFARER